MVLLATAFIACSPAPEYRAQRSISLIGIFDDATIELASREPAQLGQATFGGEERPAITVHAPTSIRFPALGIATGARLQLGVGLDDRRVEKYSDGVEFIVSMQEGGGAPEPVWSGIVDPSAAGGPSWLDVDLELERWAGRTVDLILTTDPRENWIGDWAAWSHPVIRSNGVAADISTFPVAREQVLKDLLEEAAPLQPAEPGGTPCVRRVPLKVPPGASVEIAAQILRDSDAEPGPLGPIRLALRVDDEPLLQQEWITREESIITLSRRASLDRFAGREVELTVELCNTGLGNTITWATRLWLTQGATAPRQPAEAGPNLLFVVVDTLRADHLGTYGYSRETSPELDRLAADALVFEQAMSGSSWTQPSVASLLTGRSPIEHGVIESVPLPVRYETLGERMQAAGLTTFGFSANPIVGRLEAMHRGFETFAQVPWSRAGEVGQVFGDWLDDVEGLRWFAYLQYIDPHSPYDAPEPDGSRFGECESRFLNPGRLDQLSNYINFGGGQVDYSAEDISCLIDRYDGEIRHWDTAFGRLLDDLGRRGVLDDTIVVVTSDHGEEFLEHGRLLHGYQLFEESIRVPLVVRAPGRVKPGRRPGPVETREVFSTVLALMDLPPDPEQPESLLEGGTDLWNKTYAHTTESYVPGTGYTVLAAVRDGRFKYILRPHDDQNQLYDLQADPLERTDRSGEDVQTLGIYRELLDAWLSGGVAGSQQIRGIDPESLEKLRALGYIR